MQLWALGRTARGELLKKENPEFVTVAPSAIPLKEHPEDVPRPLTKAGAAHLQRCVDYLD